MKNIHIQHLKLKTIFCGYLVATGPCRRKFLAPQAQRPMLARPLHEINFKPIVASWVAKGCQYATTVNGAESKVINRLRAKTTDTFLYK